METVRTAPTIRANRAKEDTMKVSDLMTTDVVTTTPDTPIRAVARVLVERGISGVPVCDDTGAVIGVLSEGDILLKEVGRVEARGGLLAWFLDPDSDWKVEKSQALSAGEAMSSPAITAVPYESVAAAARRMTDESVNRLPVVSSDGRLVGILTRTDLVRAFVRPDGLVAEEIREDVLRRVLWLTPGTVEVDVRDGAVRLAGELETQAEVEVLEKLVAKVPGVVSVQSDVTARTEKTARQLAGRR
jgi:CBS domain-containing protein